MIMIMMTTLKEHGGVAATARNPTRYLDASTGYLTYVTAVLCIIRLKQSTTFS